MAKRTGNSSVNSSIRQNTVDTNTGFAQLLAKQQESMEFLRKQLDQQVVAKEQQWMASSLQLDKLQQIGEVIGAGVMDARRREAEQLQKEELLKLEQQALEAKAKEKQALEEEIRLKKEAIEEAKRLNKIRAEEAAAIAGIAKNMQTFKTMGDRLTDTSKRLKENFGSMSALKTTALKAFNIGGIFNKSIAKDKFIKQQRALGSEDDRKTLAAKFENANRASKDIKDNEKEISKFKQDNELSDEQLAKTQRGKELLAKRTQLSDTYAQNDLKAGLVRQEPANGETPTQRHAKSGESEEIENEKIKQVEVQSDLLQKIADNTSGEGREQKAKEASGEGGGLLAGIGAGLKSLGGGLAGLGKGVGKGIQGLLTGIAKGIGAFGNASVLKGAAAMAILGGAVWVMGKALQEFESLDWETIGKGLVAVAGLGLIGAALGAAAAPMALGAVGLGLLGGALWVIGKAMQAVGEGFEKMTSGLERLAELDGSNLLSVAAGVGALGLAMSAFGAGQAVAGMGQLVGNLLTLGQDSPVEQLIKIGEKGQGVKDAAEGMEKLGSAMKSFSTIDKKSMQAINDFPWLKATAFVAAGGSMSINGATISNASKQNADADAAKSGVAGGGGTAIVNAPVTTNNNTSQIIKSPIRNQESSMSKYLTSRYA